MQIVDGVCVLPVNLHKQFLAVHFEGSLRQIQPPQADFTIEVP